MTTREKLEKAMDLLQQVKATADAHYQIADSLAAENVSACVDVASIEIESCLWHSADELDRQLKGGA